MTNEMTTYHARMERFKRNLLAFVTGSVAVGLVEHYLAGGGWHGYAFFAPTLLFWGLAWVLRSMETGNDQLLFWTSIPVIIGTLACMAFTITELFWNDAHQRNLMQGWVLVAAFSGRMWFEAEFGSDG